MMASQVTKAVVSGEKLGPISLAGKRLRRRSRIEIALFLIPALLFQLTWGWYPFIFTFIISLTDAQPLMPSTFTGLDSYIRVWRDPLVAQAFRTTFLYAGLMNGLTFFLPILIAIFLMELKPRLMRWMMILWFLPISVISNTIVWRYVFNTQYGLLQFITTQILHLPPGQFLNDPNQVLFWLVFPYIVAVGPGIAGLAYMAALQGVPQSYYEAAEIEGASFWRKIWTISIPRLRPVIVVALINGIIAFMNDFAWPQIMTGGQPEGASRTVVLYLVSYVMNQRYSDAAALSVFLFLVVLALIILLRTVFKEDPDA